MTGNTIYCTFQYVNDVYEGSKMGEDIDLDTYLNSISETTKTTDKRYQLVKCITKRYGAKITPTFFMVLIFLSSH